MNEHAARHRTGTPWSWWALALAVVPSITRADGGGPLLLFAGPVVFFVGQVWIVLAEVVTLRFVAKEIAWKRAFGDVVVANVKSFLLVGLVLPVCVSAAGWLVGVVLGLGLHSAGFETLSGVMSTWAMVLTGWVFNSELVRKLFPYQFLIWFAVSYVLSVIVEARVFKQRWSARGEGSQATPLRASWTVNAVSYLGLAAVLAVLVARYKWSPQ